MPRDAAATDATRSSGATAELALTPRGRVVAVPAQGRADAALPEALARDAHETDSVLLLALAALPGRPALAPVPTFWRGFAERYLTALAHVPEGQESMNVAVAAPQAELAELVRAAPPMPGGEYLDAQVLMALWSDLDVHIRAQVAGHAGGLTGWLAQHAPLLHRVGRVCFHLAENKRDPGHPFAFLATYAPRIGTGGRVQYQPLGRAIEEHAGARNRAVLVRLLSPVQRAADRLPWVKALVDSGDVFRPLAWTPAEAHRFLRDAPALEGSGLLLRLPDWWSRRPPRVRVGVSVGSGRPAGLGTEALLDFDIGLSLDGERISEAEWRRIAAGADGLVFLKGRWVEVDRARIEQALEQWKRLRREGGDGLSLLEGMRLLAGAPLDAGAVDLLEPSNAEWSEVRAGAWLESTLRGIRDPSAAAVELPPPALRATLRPYQEAGVKWLWLLSRLGLGACLADDMGLGKTIQVLALLLLAKQAREVGGASIPGRARQRDGAEGRRAALLVVPASLLGNWLAEAERFAPSLVVRCLHPSRMKGSELAAAAEDPQRFLEGVDVVLTTYSMLSRLTWLAEREWSLAVIDEAQAIKNPGARQTRAVKQMKAGARIALTGTPVENRLSDLWSIMDFACPGLLGSAKAFGSFVKRLEERSDERYTPLRTLVAPYILRRLKSDRSIIADLPDKVELQAYCSLSKRQAVLYEESVEELKLALKAAEEGIARRGAILAFILRFKQICNHPDQWLGSGGYDPAESGKFQRLATICEEIAERQERALVFTQFREMTEPLARHLAGTFGRSGLVLHGGTAVGARQELVRTFQQEGGPPFMVLSLKAGGTGLNLTAATHVIHFDRWWNPAVENQATDRAFRIGQRSTVMVHKFVCQGTIEARIDELTRSKAALAEAVLQEGVPKLVTEMSDAELLDLVKLDIRSAMQE